MYDTNIILLTNETDTESTYDRPKTLQSSEDQSLDSSLSVTRKSTLYVPRLLS